MMSAEDTGEPKTAKIQLRVEPKFLEDIDRMRRMLDPIPSRSEALRDSFYYRFNMLRGAEKRKGPRKKKGGA